MTLAEFELPHPPQMISFPTPSQSSAPSLVRFPLKNKYMDPTRDKDPDPTKDKDPNPTKDEDLDPSKDNDRQKFGSNERRMPISNEWRRSWSNERQRSERRGFKGLVMFLVFCCKLLHYYCFDVVDFCLRIKCASIIIRAAPLTRSLNSCKVLSLQWRTHTVSIEANWICNGRSLRYKCPLI